MSMRLRSLACLLVAAVGTAQAATFTVVNTLDAGPGSLRQAVFDANGAPGADTIAFAIPGEGPHVVALQGSGIGVSGPVLVDGYTQAGARVNTRAPWQGGLDGSLAIVLVPVANAPAPSALRISAGEVTLRGLVISGFGQSGGVAVAGSGVVARIEGCYFGTGASGAAAYASPGQRGLVVTLGRFHIGGRAPMQRNLFSGHVIDAVQLYTTAAADSTIEGNLFGTGADGQGMLGNGHAIDTRSAGVSTMRGLRIGGRDTSAGNVFAASGISAIRLNCAAIAQADCLDGLAIEGNAIGTDFSGVHALPNGTACPQQGCAAAAASGIDINGMMLGRVTIGGAMPGAGNHIAFNRGVGLGWKVSAGSVVGAVDIAGNRFAFNSAAGIALARNSAVPENDAGDADEGPNRFQNTPVIEHVTPLAEGTQLSVTYRVDTAIAKAAYPLRVDFHYSVDGEEGSELIGSDTYAASDAQSAKTVMLAVAPGVDALPVVAIATDAEGHSSPFSRGDLIFRNGFDPVAP